MTAAHWHLILNHVPIIGTTVATLILIAGLLLKNDQMKLTAVVCIILMTVGGFLAHETGENAEHQLRNNPEINAVALEQHEEASKPGFIIHNIAGLLSVVSIFTYRKRKKWFNMICICVVGLSISAAACMSYAGYLGGKIRHDEAMVTIPNS